MIDIHLAFSVSGGLALFLFGMKIMSEALQNVAGHRLRAILKRLTNNRFSGILTGFLLTAAVQSSSATTVMLVSFVNAGLINLTQSIGVVLGANIGTTLTGWVIAILGFKVNINVYAFPAITIGFFLRFFGKIKLSEWGDVLLGFGMLFFGLSVMKESMEVLRHSEDVIVLISKYHAHDFISLLAAVAVGALITVLIQSSSATMALTLSLAGMNLIDFPTCAALILGENIGTTVTANLAAVGASRTAKQTARAHLIFNLIGVCWVVLLFPHFLKLVNLIVPGDVFAANPQALQSILPEHLAAFHTLFNIINTLIFIPFVTTLAWLSSFILWDDPGDKQEPSRLKYIHKGHINILPLALEESKRELLRMSNTVNRMFAAFMEAFRLGPERARKFPAYMKDIRSMEDLVDALEMEITDFLVTLIRNTATSATSREIEQILNSVNNFERVGDHCLTLTKLLARLEEQTLCFTPQAEEEICRIAEKTQELLKLVNQNVAGEIKDIMVQAELLEDAIDHFRDEFRKSHIDRLNQGTCDVGQGLIFLDMLNSFEKIGDHLYNVAQAISGSRIT